MGELKGRRQQEPEGKLLFPARRPGLDTQTHVHTWKVLRPGTHCVCVVGGCGSLPGICCWGGRAGDSPWELGPLMSKRAGPS